MRRKDSARTSNAARTPLRIEELEERIAPVLITSNPSSWIQGSIPDPADPDDRIDIVNAWGDMYWIFYLGPGQAEINAGTFQPTDLIGQHITDVTITGSTMDSALFIMDFPGDDTPDNIPFGTEAGSMLVNGNVIVTGDIGLIEIDGLLSGGVLNVNGDLGKLDVGSLTSDVFVAGDIYEISVDFVLGGTHNGNIYTSLTSTWIEANGNIGAIRVGVGLTDLGEAPDTISLIGGSIGGGTYIRANADSSGAPGIIDLIEVRGGSILPGDLGQGQGDVYPTLSAGPGGNIRFLRLDGNAYWVGAGNQNTLEPITVTSETPLIERTIVDDSGGVLVINPQDMEYDEDPLDEVEPTVWAGSASYLIIPVDPITQGPGALVARLTVDNSNSFNVTGNVEIGELRIDDAEIEFPELLAQDFTDLVDAEGNPIPDITQLPVESATDLTDLEGYAHLYFGGSGEADIYFVNAMAEFGAGGSSVPIIINNTDDGDIVAVGADTDVIYVGASGRGGDIGATESISPYLVKSPIAAIDANVLWVDINEDPIDVTFFGVEGSLTRYNTVQGVLAGGSVYGVKAGGAVGDVRALAGDIRFVAADANNSRDPGSPLTLSTEMFVPVTSSVDNGTGLSGTIVGGVSFTGSVSISGRTDNIVGDGIFGLVMAGEGPDFRDNLGLGGLSGGGNINLVRVGEGSQPTWVYGNNDCTVADYADGSGQRIGAGIYTNGSIDRVLVNGSGHGIYGDVIANTNWADTGFAINRVAATNGAVIDGSMSTSAFSRISVVVAHARLLSQIGSGGTLGLVSASGAGSYISNLNTDAQAIHRMVATGGGDGAGRGILHSSIGANSSPGRIDLISTDADIYDCRIHINGAGGTIQTTGRTSSIESTSIQALAGLKRLKTNALIDDNIYILTLGGLSRLDTIEDTVFMAGGIRSMWVRNDIADSWIRVNGPLKRMTVNGGISESWIESMGIYGNIGRIIVRGDIADTTIFSGGGIGLVKSRTGSILETVDIDPGEVPPDNTDLPMQIIAGGAADIDPDLPVTITARIGRVQAAGDIEGTISLGLVNEFLVDPTEDRTVIAQLGSVRAGGDISADIYAGIVDIAGDLPGVNDVQASAGSIIAGGSISGSIWIGSIGTANGGALGPGDMNADQLISARVGTVRAGTDITGGVFVGYLDSSSDINGNVTVTASSGPVKAGNALTSDLVVGYVEANNNINADVAINARVASVAASGSARDINIDVQNVVPEDSNTTGQDIDIAVDLGSGTATSRGSISGEVAVGYAVAANNVNGVTTIDARIGSVLASGNIGNVGVNVTNFVESGNTAGAVNVTVDNIINSGSITGDIIVGRLEAANDVNGPVQIDALGGAVRATGRLVGEITVDVENEVAADSTAGDINVTLDNVIRAGSVSGDIMAGTVFAGNDINAPVVIEQRSSAIAAYGTITANVNVGMRDITNVANVVPAGSNTTGVDINIAALASDINLDVTLGTAGAVAAGSITGDILEGFVEAVGDVNSTVSIDGGLVSIIASGSIADDIALTLAAQPVINVVNDVADGNDTGDVNITVTGGTVNVSADDGLDNTVTVSANPVVNVVNNVAATSTTGDINVNATAGDLNVDVEADDSVSAARPQPQVTVRNNVQPGGSTGVVNIVAPLGPAPNVTYNSNLANILAEGDVGNDVLPGDPANLVIGGNLGRMLVGTRVNHGDLLSNVSIAGNAGTVNVTGSITGSLAVGGNTAQVIVGGDAGEAGDSFVFNGNLGSLIVRDSDVLTLANLEASVNVAGNAALLNVEGDVAAPVDIGGNAGRILTSRILSDITIAGNLNYLLTQSGVFPGTPPVDYEFINPGDATGTLTVTGDIGTIV